MILGQLTMGARQTKNAPLVEKALFKGAVSFLGARLNCKGNFLKGGQ